MEKKVSITNALELSVAERIQLVEDIWDSIAAVPESVDLPPAQRDELRRRLEAFHADPEAGSPWEEVKAEIRHLA